MSSDKKRNIMPDAIGYIDDDIISGTLEKIDKEDKMAYRQRRRTSSWAVPTIALAACVLIAVFALPRTRTIISDSDIPGAVGAPEGSSDEQHEYDGSRGLLYEINENGTSASFVGFGNCTDRIVRIASTYCGLPVTVMYNENSLHSIPYNQSKLWHIKQIVVSDTVKYFDTSFISMCPNIESVYIGAAVENLTSFQFSVGYGVKFRTVEVSPDNPNYAGKGNCVIDKRTKALVFATCLAVIPDDGSVEIIGNRAFDPARYGLGSIVIPEGVKIIDREAFGQCDKLLSVTLPDSLEVIEAEAFSSCKNLEKLEIGTNLKAIDVAVFYPAVAPKVYYRGTVLEWESVYKTNTHCIGLTVAYTSDRRIIFTENSKEKPAVFTVICADGESNSYAGVVDEYNWRSLPEYKEYMKREKESYTRYQFGYGDGVTKIYPWDKYVGE